MSDMDIDVIEMPQRSEPLAIATCCSTSNLMVACDNLVIIYAFRREHSKFNYIDFVEAVHVFHAFSHPIRVQLVHNVVACMSAHQLHIFRVEAKEDENDCYFSPTDPSSLASATSPESPNYDDNCPPSSLNQSNTIKLAYREESEIHASNCDYNSTVVSSAAFDFNLYSSDNVPHVATTAKFILDSHPVEASCISLVHRRISPKESELMQCLSLKPVFWSDVRMRQRKSHSFLFKNPLVPEERHSHLMSLFAVVANRNEAHLFHLPAHNRRCNGNGGQEEHVGHVHRMATVAFTAPLIDLEMDAHVLHVLTEVGLETYTLSQLGFYALWEVQSASLAKGTVNALPVNQACDVPVCLVGLKNFPKLPSAKTSIMKEPRRSLLLSSNHLLLLIDGFDGENNGTLYSLSLPSSTSLQTELLQLAEVNRNVSPQGYFHLLCEAFFTLRLLRLRRQWLRQEIDDMDNKLEQLCLCLANFFLPTHCTLASAFFRMSKTRVSQIVGQAITENSMQDSAWEGLMYYISQVIVHPKSDDEIGVTSDADLMDKIIALLRQRSKDTIVELVILSPSFRAFKSSLILEAMDEEACAVKTFAQLAKLLLLLELQMNDKAQSLLVSVLEGDSELLLEALFRHADSLLVHSGSQTLFFSDFAILLRDNQLHLFLSLLVRVANRRRGKLDLTTIISLLRKAPLSAMATINLVLFLEEYFLNCKPQNEDDFKALKQLLHCYLTLLSGEMRVADGADNDECVLKVVHFHSGVNDFFEELGRLEVSDSETSELQRVVLKNIQSLLLAFAAIEPSLANLTMDHLKAHPSSMGQLALTTLCLPWQQVLQQLVSERPQLSVPYLKHRHKAIVEEEWKLLLQTLNARLASAEDETHALHEDWYSAMQEALDYLASKVGVECFERVLPDEEQGTLQQEEFHNYLQVCKKNQQAKEMESLIADTATQLLKHLSD